MALKTQFFVGSVERIFKIFDFQRDSLTKRRRGNQGILGEGVDKRCYNKLIIGMQIPSKTNK